MAISDYRYDASYLFSKCKLHYLTMILNGVPIWNM